MLSSFPKGLDLSTTPYLRRHLKRVDNDFYLRALLLQLMNLRGRCEMHDKDPLGVAALRIANLLYDI